MEFLSSSCALILNASLAYLPLDVVFKKIRVLSKDSREVVDFYLSGLKTIYFSHITFTSSRALREMLIRWFKLSTCRELVFISTRMRLAAEDSIQPHLSKCEMKCHTCGFPLGVLPHMASLEYVRVESQSVKQEFLQQVQMRSVQREVPTNSAPLQFGLANLHELASGSCRKLKRLHCLHLERNRFGEVSDCWGPDCTLEVARQLRHNCAQLVEIGVLSSPGPRMQLEMKRMQRTFKVSENAEMNETFRKSFLEEISSLFANTNTLIVVSLASYNAPESSSRSAVFAAHQHQMRGDFALGELNDLLSINASTHIQVFVRAVAYRAHGKFSARGMRETAELESFRHKLRQSRPNLTMFCVPGDGILSVIQANQFIVQCSVIRMPVSRSISWSAAQDAAANINNNQHAAAVVPPSPEYDSSMLVDEPWDFRGGGVFRFV